MTTYTVALAQKAGAFLAPFQNPSLAIKSKTAQEIKRKDWRGLSLLTAMLWLQLSATAQAPTLEVGNKYKRVLGLKTVMSGGPAFTVSDSLHFLLWQPTALNTRMVLFEIAQLSGGRYATVLSEQIIIAPESRQVMGHYQATDLIQRFGYGHFKATVSIGAVPVVASTYSLVRTVGQ